jgi:hypothetical protein
MSEGEFKKRVDALDADSLEMEIDAILDEAKKEYLGLNDIWLKDHPGGVNDWHVDELADMRNDWFKKWFGDSP